MPRKDTTKVRGLWDREKGSGVWWIRYRAEGVLKREKVGTKERNGPPDQTQEWYQGRDQDAREHAQTSVRFKTLCDDILVYSKQHHRDFRKCGD